MDYEQKYKEALERAREIHNEHKAQPFDVMIKVFPELAKSEDERIRKWIIGVLSTYEHDKDLRNTALAWLEKQGECELDCPQNHQDVNSPNGCIVLENFNGGEGFYKIHLDYLNKEQVEEVEEMVREWNKESKTSDENIKDCIGMCLTDVDEQRFKDFNTNLKDCLNWLEKQGKEQKIPNYGRPK